MSKTKGFLLAVAVATMAFTFSCSSDDDEKGSEPSSSGGGEQSSPSGGDGSSSSVDSGGDLSSSGGGGGESSSSVTAQVDLEGTWNASGGRAVVFDGSKFIYKVDTLWRYSGSFSVSDTSLITFKIQLGTVSGNIEIISGDSIRLYNNVWDNSVDGLYIKDTGNNVLPSSSSVGSESSSSFGAGSQFNPNIQYIDFIDDRDGKTYKTVVIGNQTWLAENLNYEAEGSKCYDNDPTNCAKYGRLYDWNTAVTVCPSGWHLPSNEEWDVGGIYADTAGTELKAKIGWNSNGNGTDIYGFSALPSGVGYPGGNFGSIGDYGLWWSGSEYDSETAYYRLMYHYSKNVGLSEGIKSILHSVRCVQGDFGGVSSSSSEAEQSSSSLGGGDHFNPDIQYIDFVDKRDGTTYKSVVIDTLVLMAENLNYAGEAGSEIGVCYNNDPANCAKYGRLYDWETAMTACPSGWHLPYQTEWSTITAYVGGEDIEGKKLKATSGWNNRDDGTPGNGTDDYGFSALPGGRSYSDGSFHGVGIIGDWWSASEYEYDSDYAYRRYMDYRYESATWYSQDKSLLFSVRCVKDTP